uniref:Isoform GM2 of Membrane cofactor protein n=2 Tax=Cavia porcellus TaxID=10141 RepID=P70105-3|nr:membrane cofactor protein precursor [Cavia porcellus]
MAPPLHGESRAASWWRILGACLLAAVFLLAASSDACVLPPPFEAMEPINPKPYYEIGEKVEYRCKKGYLRQPFYLMVATCEKNHSWVPITDDGCIKKQCTYLNPPPKGRVEYINGTRTWGDIVHFSCVEGFYVSGIAALSCELRGDNVDWNGRVPTCEKVLCSPPPKIQNGKYTFSDVQVFEYFEAVTYSCDAVQGPDKLSLVGNEVLYCAGHQKWSSAAPECKGPKPTHPTKPPVYNYPGYPNPREGIFDQELNLWIIILLILIAVVGLALILLCACRFFERKKKSPEKVMPAIQISDHMVNAPILMPSTVQNPMKR